MLERLYQNWQKSCFPLAIFTTVILCSCLPKIGWLVFCVWLQFPIYLLHETEEHVWPGKFKEFINANVFNSHNSNFPLSSAIVFWINIPFIWTLFPICAVLAQNYDMRFAAILPVFAMFNATLHVIAACVKRKYNPGLCVSVLLNYPTGIYTLRLLHEANWLNEKTAILAFLVALISHMTMIIPIVIRYKRHKAMAN